MNLLDGDAQTVAFTVATRERMSVFQRLGGWRMAMLHAAPSDPPAAHGASGGARVAARGVRARRRRAGAATHAQRRTVSVHSRAEQRHRSRSCRRWRSCSTSTSAFRSSTARSCSTTSSGHHFGPSSFQALRDLRRTDARIREIRRMIDSVGGRAVRPRHCCPTTG